MLTIVLLLVYLWDGQVKVETIPMKSLEECVERAPVIMTEKLMHPKFDAGYYADCITVKQMEAKNEKN